MPGVSHRFWNHSGLAGSLLDGMQLADDEHRDGVNHRLLSP